MNSFAIPPGMTDEQIRQFTEVSSQDTSVLEEQSVPIKPSRKRARDEDGRLKADDPSTPQNEAWVQTET